MYDIEYINAAARMIHPVKSGVNVSNTTMGVLCMGLYYVLSAIKMGENAGKIHRRVKRAIHASVLNVIAEVLLMQRFAVPIFLQKHSEAIAIACTVTQ